MLSMPLLGQFGQVHDQVMGGECHPLVRVAGVERRDGGAHQLGVRGGRGVLGRHGAISCSWSGRSAGYDWFISLRARRMAAAWAGAKSALKAAAKPPPISSKPLSGIRIARRAGSGIDATICWAAASTRGS